VAGVLSLACAAAIAATALSPVWRIRAVTVEGAHHVGADAAVAASALEDTQAFTASTAKARERVLRSLAAVRDARVEIRIPDQARIVLIERVAIGKWSAAGTEWFIDGDGYLFSSIDPRGAPDLRVTDERGARQAGDRLDPALVDAAMKLARLGPQDLRADATSPRVILTAGGEGLVLRVASGWEIRFGGAERMDEKIALARRYLRDNPQRKLDYLDVRTPDQIVFSPK
jgi:cell division septal protein FtsQ